MTNRILTSVGRLVASIGIALLLAACASTGRAPYSISLETAAIVPGIPSARVWSDDSTTLLAAIRRTPTGETIVRSDGAFLALSGGGAQGAYGAGFLACWTKSGERPEFAVVTGASVGALIAPFAFLGPAYDPLMTRMFTSGDTDGLLQFAGLPGLFGTSLFREEPLAHLVDTYVTRDLLRAISAEYAKGRGLYVVTTNLDSQRTAVWDMGAIATSDRPQALALFKSVLLASASIPGIFPPELIQVESNGQTFSEMHVDGSVTANILVIPEAILTSRETSKDFKPEIYVIVNGKIGPDFQLVNPSVVPIFQRSFETTLKANTRNALIANADYARQRGWDLRMTAIPDAAQSLSPTDFDTRKMNSLYDFGCSTAQGDQRWSKGF